MPKQERVSPRSHQSFVRCSIAVALLVIVVVRVVTFIFVVFFVLIIWDARKLTNIYNRCEHGASVVTSPWSQ